MAGKKQFYAVAKGRRPGIYLRWTGAGGAEEQVSGYAGAIFRGFATREEAEAFLAAGGKPSPAALTRLPLREKAAPATASPARPAAQEEYHADLAAGKVVIFTDGASTGNPGPGGYGAVILAGDQRRELAAGFRCTTNNRMELMGVIAALEAVEPPAPVVVYSDSRYVVDALTKGWAARWRRNNWMRAADSPAENADLWARLLRLLDARPGATFRWVRGHASSAENERCDRLAVHAAHQPNLPADSGFTRRC